MIKQPPGLLQGFSVLLRRDLLLAFRRRSELVQPLLFFVLMTILFPFGVGSDMKLLQEMAAGVIWVGALLAAMLSLDAIFRADYEDGSLEQLLLNAQPASIIVLAKVLAHWLISGLPLILVAPVLALMLGMPEQALGVLMLSLLLGTPVLSLIGAIGSALTVGLHRGGFILSLLVLPLYIPVLIFASQAVDLSMAGFDVSGQLSMLMAFFLLALVLAPAAIAAALKISMG
ncbi:MAG: heme exporter protein CcmB [Gammaproteobacteria bacterium]|nr:heme exporter protein CcmB [Gammaproteobacteria bacterium]